MVLERKLASGTRVRLVAPSCLLELRTATGTVVRKDQWADYYIIRLDEPALYHGGQGTPETLCEIAEDIDNLEVIETE
jgi:hypothetical protein